MSSQDVSPASLADRSAGRQLSPVFPKTRNSLWDKSSVGQPTFLHLGHYRKPRICVPEKILKLVQHQCENYGQGSHVLIGSLVVDDDGEGVQIQVDRLDTRTNVPLTSASLAVGGVVISFQVTNNAAGERTVSADDYLRALELLQNRCCSKNSIDLCEFIYLYGCGSFYSNTLTTVAHLDFDLVTLGTTFRATPITPVPVAVTALSKNLVTPRNLSSLQGTPKTGYLTMDSTRKAMLVLESDPKCATLPIVGIWVSGVDFLHQPFVWAACLRYIYCTYLQDRACKPPEEFLLILYRQLQTRPEFYQCATSLGDSGLQFELNTGHETINMDKILASPGSGDFVEVEMNLVEDGQKRQIFDAALEQHSSAAAQDAVFNGHEDLEPRCAPMPHAEKVPVFRPMVPEVSVYCSEPYEHVTRADTMPGVHTNKFAPRHKPTSGSPVELFSKQHYPEQNFSRPLTIPANGQHMTGHCQQPQVLQTRSPLSYQYTPAGQHQGAALTSFQQLLPQTAPTPHSQQYFNAPPVHSPHNFYVNGNGMSPSAPSATPQIYPTHPQNTSSQHVTTPGASYHFTAPVSQTSQPTPSHHMISSSHMNYSDVLTRPPSHDRNQHLGTPVFPHVNTQSLPEFTGVGCNIPAQNTHNSNCYISPNINNEVRHCIDNSQFINTSVARGGQQAGIIPSEAHSQVCTANGQGVNLIPPATYAFQQHQLSSNKALQHGKEALKTINEERSLSPFLQTMHQHQELPGSGVKEVNSRANTAEVNCSSVRLPSINSSARSNVEDSGLDTTSDRLSMSFQHPRADSSAPADSHPAPAKTSCACASSSCAQQIPAESIVWEKIPPQVMTFLAHQNEQLKQLQRQIQILMSEKAQTNRGSPQDTRSATHQKTSVAVNTSFTDEPIAASQCHYDSKSTQVTPVRRVSQQQEFISPAASCKQTDTPKTMRSPVKASQMPAGHHMTPAAHQLVPQPQQGSCAYVQKDINQTEFSRDASGMPSFDDTVNTNLSELEGVSFNDRSQSDWSPTSASDYNRRTQESCSTLSGDAVDRDHILNQVMKNISRFLGSGDHQTDSPSSLPVVSEPQTAPQVSPSRLDNSTGSCVIPEADSETMHSVFGTDPSQTVELNALAMKYLSDEQLVKVAKLRQTAPSRSHSSAYSAKILEQVMGGSVSTSDVSQFGMSPCDMTVDTWRYLQKHGLTGNDRSTVGLSMLDTDLKLRTDFSIFTNGSTAGNINLSPETTVDEAQFLRLRTDLDMCIDPASSPLRFKTHSRANNENWLPEQARNGGGYRDMGASPMLPASKNSAKNGPQGYIDRDQHILQDNSRRRNVLQEVSPQAFINVKTGANISPRIKPYPEGEEEEAVQLFDFSALKQLPKLL